MQVKLLSICHYVCKLVTQQWVVVQDMWANKAFSESMELLSVIDIASVYGLLLIYVCTIFLTSISVPFLDLPAQFQFFKCSQ